MIRIYYYHIGDCTRLKCIQVIRDHYSRYCTLVLSLTSLPFPKVSDNISYTDDRPLVDTDNMNHCLVSGVFYECFVIIVLGCWFD